MRVFSFILGIALVSSVVVCAPRVTASPGNGLKIVGPRGETTPVVNERGRLALKVVDASGTEVAVRSWSSDNKAVGKVSRRGQLKGKAFGFASVTAQTDRGAVSGFVVVARVRRQGGAMARGDTKADTGGNVYLSSPQQHVVYRSDGLLADVFAGASGQNGYAEGTGGNVRFDGPAGLGVDNRAEGGVYVADTANHCVRKIDFRGRSSLAVGTPRLSGTMHGDETQMSEAVMNGPRGVASVGSSLFVTDTENHCVWYVDTQRQRVYLVAGSPDESGLVNGVGRGARLNRPSGIAINTRGNLLAVADTGNNVIRLVGIVPRPGGGVVGEVTTLGQGSSARGARITERLRDDRGEDVLTFDAPESVSFDGVDNVYVVDRQTASVVTRGRDFVERVELAQRGTLGDPASVTVRRTRAFVLDEGAADERTAVSVVEVGAPTIDAVTPDADQLEGGTQVTIRGRNFAPESRVTLGDAEVDNLVVDSSRQIRFTVPAQQAPGNRTLTVATRGGVDQAVFRIRVRPLSALAAGEITTVVGSLAYPGDGALAQDTSVAITPPKVAIDGAGNLFIADWIGYRIRRVDVGTGVITTVAGNGVPEYSGDGGPAITAGLHQPRGIGVDASGNLFIADTINHRIRRVDAATSRIATVAGTGIPGFGGDGGTATSARISQSWDVEADRAGNLFIADTSNNRVRRVDASTGIITTVAGTGTLGFGGDGGPATAAALSRPIGLAVDAAGNLFVADTGNHRVRRVDAATGVIQTVAGIGAAAFDGDGGPATAAALNAPGDVAFDAAGNLFVADQENQRVRRVDAATGIITSVAGNGLLGDDPEHGSGTFSGDGGPATAAGLSNPTGVVVDGAGNLFVAELGNKRVRRVDATTGTIETVAGSGFRAFDNDGGPAVDARVLQPDGLALDGSGNLFFSDSIRHSIRRVDGASGIIDTLAGLTGGGFAGDGGPAADARFFLPRGLAFDGAGGLLIADRANNRVRRIDAASGVITTVAGDGQARYGGDGGPALEASLNSPSAVAVDAAGNLFIADSGNHRIRRVDASGVITTVAGTGEAAFFGDGGPATAAAVRSPAGLAFDPAGNLYVAAQGNNRIRRVDVATGVITTVAGSGGGFGGDGGPATAALLTGPVAVAFDGAGHLFIVDQGNTRIRRVDAATGIITTVAGDGANEFEGDHGPAAAASLLGPLGVAVDRDGNLLISHLVAIRAVKGIAVPVER